jgi:hypothetical protein
MANAFEFVDKIDYSALGKLSKQNDEIMIGFPSGMPHAGTGETISDIAKKLSYGSGPQTWMTSRQRQLGVNKLGKPRMSKKAITQTFSVQGIPARPFLEEGILDGKSDITAAIEYHYKNLVESGNKNGLYRVAAVCVAAVQKFVRGDYYKSLYPNSKTTIEDKKSDTPLIDTGQMVNSVTSVINGQRSGK